MIETFGASDVGCVRELNEDCFCIKMLDNEKNKGFFILADGMGGHNAGEVASQTAVKVIAEQFKVLEDALETEIESIIMGAIAKANECVYKMAAENEGQSGMGTTVVAVVLWDKTAYIANIGDSRAYITDENEICQITSDHSVVEELIKRGTITKEEARRHPQKNIITRAVGTDPEVDADLFECEAGEKNCILLCSDGLSSMVDDDEIYGIIKTEKNSEDTVCKLIDTAKHRGGLDNITAVCIRFV